MFSNILFPTDFSSSSNQALQHALAFARQCGAKLHLFHVDTVYAYNPAVPDHEFLSTNDPYPLTNGNGHNGSSKDSEGHRLVDLFGSGNTGDIQVNRAERRSIRVPDAILEYAAEQNIDLMIMGTHGRKGLSRWLLGSIAEEVIDRAQCPVITLRSSAAAPEFEVKKVLAPVVFGEGCQETLKRALALADLFGADLHILHVFGGEELKALGLNPEDPNAAHKMLGSLLQELGHKSGRDTTWQIHFHSGDPREEILEFARENDIDLIVMGHQKARGKALKFFASITKGVLREAECPVFAMPLLPEPAGVSAHVSGQALAI